MHLTFFAIELPLTRQASRAAQKKLLHENSDCANTLLLFELPERIAGETELFGSIDVRTDGIVIFTGEEWSNLETRVERLPDRNPEARRFKRLILGWACEIWVEDGHVRIPVPLYEEARISRGSQITDHKTYCILQETDAAPESGPNER